MKHLDVLNLVLCARLRAQIAAAEGDILRYWREMAGLHLLLGESAAASNFERQLTFYPS
jgi:hypothetical protein